MAAAAKSRRAAPGARKAKQSGAQTGPQIDDIVSSWARERPDLDQDALLLQIMVMRLGRVVERAYDRRCQERFGVSGADMRILLALRRAGAPFVRRPTDLYRALLVTSGAITKQVDRLASAEFVERLPDPDHAGGFLVQLTSAGRRAADGAVEQLAGESVLAGRYDPAMLPRVIDFHRQLIATLEDV